MHSLLDSERKKLRFSGILAGAISLPLLVYLLSLAPDLTWAHGGADGGDLIVAAYTLGVPHPPGYPAYTLLAHFFTLLPFGSIAFRVNLLSAMGAAIAAGSVALSVLALRPQDHNGDVIVGAIAAAWGLAFTPMVWSQAVIAEVYAAHAAFVALTIWLAILIYDKPTIIRAWILGLVWGISFGFHLTAIFLLPIVAWGLIGKNPRSVSAHLFIGLIIGISLASLQWLYLPLRAGKGAFTWGNPLTLDGWWWLVSGALYRDYVFAFPVEKWLDRLAFFAKSLLIGFGPVAVLLAAIEWERMARNRWGLVLAWAISLFAYVVFAVGYNTTDSDSYLIPALIIFSIIFGSGIAQALKWTRARWRSKGVIVVASVVLIEPLLILWLNWSSVSLSSDRAAVRFGQKVMDSVPSTAVLITTEDRTTFAVWYFQYVLKQRSDITAINPGLLEFDWYRAQIGLTSAESQRIVNKGIDGSERTVCRIPETSEFRIIQCSTSLTK